MFHQFVHIFVLRFIFKCAKALPNLYLLSQQAHHVVPVHHQVHLVVTPIPTTIVVMYFSHDPTLCHKRHLLATEDHNNGKCKEMKCQEGKPNFLYLTFCGRIFVFYCAIELK